MLLTRASEYALLSLILISKSKNPRDVETLSHELAISKSFLAKILQCLAREGILVSYKGAHGGFRLNREPQNISIKSIIDAAEKKPAAVFDCSPAKDKCPRNEGELCMIWPFLNKLQIKIDEVLKEMSLKDIL